MRRKGYLTPDDRGHGHAGYWRLRFRLGGVARAVYLGRDISLIEQVRHELAELQQEHVRDRRVDRLVRHGNKLVRTTKRRLEPALKQLGFHYHGDALRKIRAAKSVGR